jgi:hypothetical protein
MKTLALRARVFIYCFLVFGYPGETLALVVHILHQIFHASKLAVNCIVKNRKIITVRIVRLQHYYSKVMLDSAKMYNKVSQRSLACEQAHWEKGEPARNHAFYSIIPFSQKREPISVDCDK